MKPGSHHLGTRRETLAANPIHPRRLITNLLPLEGKPAGPGALAA